MKYGYREKMRCRLSNVREREIELHAKVNADKRWGKELTKNFQNKKMFSKEVNKLRK